jgi:hypothetical protein
MYGWESEEPAVLSAYTYEPHVLVQYAQYLVVFYIPSNQYKVNHTQ